jgi:putative holliday junction resolvase
VIRSPGRLLGVDYGTVRIGLSITDPDRILASPLETYSRRTVAQDAAYLANLVRVQGITGIVLGIAVSLNGHEGPKAQECRTFGTWLESATGLPVQFSDERFTSALADDLMFDAKMTRQKRNERRDMLAATLILKGFLEGGCEPYRPQPPGDQEV